MRRGARVDRFAAGRGERTAPAAPPYPEVPEVTEPLEAALEDGGDTIVPVVGPFLAEFQIAAHTAGPLLRPGCSAVGTVVVATVLGAGYIPVRVPVATYLTPISAFCLSAFNTATLDYQLADVDAAVGPAVTDVNDAAVVPRRTRSLRSIRRPSPRAATHRS